LTSKVSTSHSENSKQSQKRGKGKQDPSPEEETPEPAPPAEVLGRADTVTKDVGSVAASTSDSVRDEVILRGMLNVS
jgi:hypothetical protein